VINENNNLKSRNDNDENLVLNLTNPILYLKVKRKNLI